MLKRRDLLTLALGGATAAAEARIAAAQATAPDSAAPDGSPSSPSALDNGAVVNAAARLAAKPFQAPTASLPKEFANLSYDQYVGIRNLPSSRVWADENVGFAIEPLHRGFIFTTPMTINIVENGQARKLVYQSSEFDLGRLHAPADIPDIGFSGFRVLQVHPPADPAEVAVFQGASFYRAIANGQKYGVMARGLAVRTGDARGEEFPLFREVWIEKPSLATDTIVIHALLDSQSVTGAYRFTLRPGDLTIIDTECTLFARVALDNYGLSPMAGAWLLGPIAPKSADVRPRAYDFSGLRMLSGRQEWIWRPIANRDTLQVSSFIDENPAGFGVVQSDRSFQKFLDDDHHWEMRPTLWVEPIGDLGAGSVDLLEIPSESDINQNIIAYWRPKAALQPGKGTRFAYRQFWCWEAPARPRLASVVTSRVGRVGGSSSSKRRFLVEFASDMFANVDAPTPAASLTASAGAVSEVRSFVTPSSKTFRVLFDLDPGSQTASELRLVLEQAGKPVSETWLFRWTS